MHQKIKKVSSVRKGGYLMFTRQVFCAILSLSMFLGLCNVATAKSEPILPDIDISGYYSGSDQDAFQTNDNASPNVPSEQNVRRYVNPLPLEFYPVLSSGSGDRFDWIDNADPVVVRHDGQYYLFATGGMAWVSSDLVNWKYHPVTIPEGRFYESAPHVAEYKGNFYMCGNTQDFFRSPHPLGPWEFIGEFKDEKGKTFGLFDAMMFVDDDERVYMYFCGGGGISGVELDQNDLSKFKSAPTLFFRFDPSHIWERLGDRNEYSKISFIEAPWMTKHNGTYYLQYSGPGTEWKTYAVGYYTSSSPLGPFTYYSGSPILLHNKGLINGVGHHCVIDAPDGTLWAFFNINYQSGLGGGGGMGRRIGMDPVEIDEDGNMNILGPTETPQWGPGLKTQALDDAIGGVIPVSVSKDRYSVSSEAPGRDAQYAFDNYVRTWWEADANDPQPRLMIDLGFGNSDQEFIINSSRIIFTAHKWLKRSTGIVTGPYQYKIEVSSDGETFKTAIDKTKNNLIKNVEYDEIDPVRCRYVRLTITGAPPNVPVCIIEFTVFGNPVESK